jgi:hypothetical protein
MKDFSKIMLVLFALLTGCTASFRTTLPDGPLLECETTGDPETILACYRDHAAQERELLAVKPEQKVEKTEEVVVPNRPSARPAARMSRRPVEFIPMYIEDGQNKCMPGHSVSFINRTSNYIEVTARKLVPCDLDKNGMVHQFVRTASGGIRLAWLIPPGSYGWFTTADGGPSPLPYLVVAYDQLGYAGRSEQMPRVATGGTYRNDVSFPIVNGNWYRVQINAQDVDLRYN